MQVLISDQTIESFYNFQLSLHNKLYLIETVKNINSINRMISSLANDLLPTNDYIRYVSLTVDIDNILHITLVICVSLYPDAHEISKHAIEYTYDYTNNTLDLLSSDAVDVLSKALLLSTTEVTPSKDCNRNCDYVHCVMSTIDKLSPAGKVFIEQNHIYHTVVIYTLESTGITKYKCIYDNNIDKYIFELYKTINADIKTHTSINGEVLTYKLLLYLCKSVDRILYIELISECNTITFHNKDKEEQ